MKLMSAMPSGLLTLTKTAVPTGLVIDSDVVVMGQSLDAKQHFRTGRSRALLVIHSNGRGYMLIVHRREACWETVVALVTLTNCRQIILATVSSV